MTPRFGQGLYTLFWPEDIPAYIMRVQGWAWSWVAGVQRLPGDAAWLMSSLICLCRGSRHCEAIRPGVVPQSWLRLGQLWRSKRSQSFVQRGEISTQPTDHCMELTPKQGRSPAICSDPPLSAALPTCHSLWDSCL